MANLEEIIENRRTRETDGSRGEDDKHSTRRNTTKRQRSWIRQNSLGSQSLLQTPPPVYNSGLTPKPIPEERRQSRQRAGCLEQDEQSASDQEEHRAEFYKGYYRVAKDHDEATLKNRKEDLDTLLIFAGLFSAVATAFITQAESQLQIDPGNETNALLRVLIYKIDNTTFGDDVPALPHPSSPPVTRSVTQHCLFLSLAISLFCASIAMLCKDWLNRYAWTDVEGSITEHGQNRQIKLDGLRTWRFLYLMDFLQFMLQFSLFLFGFGLIGSFWSTNLAAASSITAIISFGVLVFASLCVSGMISENCPYRTFISVRPRALWQRVRSLVHTKTALDLRSISWILQSSLDEAVRLSAFKYLISIPELPKIHPTLVADCFHVFTGSIAFSNGKVVIRQGSEQLSTMSARCFFRTFHHLSVKDPTSGALKDLRQCYDKLFPLDTDFRGLPFQDTMTMVHILIKGRLSSGPVEWDNDGLSTQERIPLAWYMVGAAQAGYEETERKKVPRWVLRFALESLPLNPPPPSSVVADCLKIIAIDLDCDVSDITTVDESARVEQVSNMIARQLKTMVETTHPDQIFSKRKAISALFPYAISLERHGQRGMADEILRAAMIPFSRRFLWRRMETMLFAESSSPSLNRTITLASPYLPWTDGSYDQHAVDRWAAAALAVEYTEEVGQSVVDVLLQIASDDTLRPQIPDGVWAFLKKEVSLPPTCRGLLLGTGLDVVLHIRGRGDIDILKSYYLLVLSEWNFLPDEVVNELETSIKEDFGGARMWGHREDLISRVNYVIAQLDWGSGFLDQEKPGGVGEEAIEHAKEHYSKLRDALLKVHMETMETLTRSYTTFNCIMPVS